MPQATFANFTGSFEKLKGLIFYSENVGALYFQQLHWQNILILMFYLKDNVIHNMAWWLKSAGALNFALSQEQCPISL